MESIRIDILNPKAIKMLNFLAELELIRFNDDEVSEVDNIDSDRTNIIDSINKGIEDSKKGNLKSHSEARKVYEKWL